MILLRGFARGMLTGAVVGFILGILVFLGVVASQGEGDFTTGLAEGLFYCALASLLYAMPIGAGIGGLLGFLVKAAE